MRDSRKRPEPIRVAVVADVGSAAQRIAASLQDTGYAVRPFSLTIPGAYDRVRELCPAVVLLRSSARSLSAAASFSRIAAHGGPALVLLTPVSHDALGLALDSGALVHLVEPVPAQAIAAAVRVAAARAQDLRNLNSQLTKLRETLQSRRLVERAKAVLIRRLGLTEEEAHRRLQRESRNRNRKLVDTAAHVIRADAQLSRTARADARRRDDPETIPRAYPAAPAATAEPTAR
jgi:AmiR/NasT family two-component response regulator